MIAKARHPRTFVVGSSKSTATKAISIISSKDGTPLPLSASFSCEIISSRPLLLPRRDVADVGTDVDNHVHVVLPTLVDARELIEAKVSRLSMRWRLSFLEE